MPLSARPSVMAGPLVSTELRTPEVNRPGTDADGTNPGGRDGEAVPPLAGPARAGTTLEPPKAGGQPLRNRVSVTQHTFASWDLAECLNECRAAGVGAIGLSVPKVRAEGYERAAELVGGSPVEVSSLNWIAGFTGQNDHRLHETMDEAPELIRLASLLGAPTVTVITGPKGTHSNSHITNVFIDSLRELADFADFFGVDLAVLPMTPRHRAGWTFLDSLPKAMEVVRRADHPRVGLCLNTGFVWRQKGLPTLLREAAPVTKLVKLSDCSGSPRHANDQRLPGQGRVRTTAIAAALDAAGYRGYYELDVWSEGLWRSGDTARVLRSFAGLAFGSCPDLADGSPQPAGGHPFGA